MFWSLSSFDPRYRLSREENLHPKLSRGGSVIPHVECHQSIRSAIHSCLQHHLIVGIAQLRPPQKVRSHGFRRGRAIETLLRGGDFSLMWKAARRRQFVAEISLTSCCHV